MHDVGGIVLAACDYDSEQTSVALDQQTRMQNFSSISRKRNDVAEWSKDAFYFAR